MGLESDDVIFQTWTSYFKLVIWGTNYVASVCLSCFVYKMAMFPWLLPFLGEGVRIKTCYTWESFEITTVNKSEISFLAFSFLLYYFCPFILDFEDLCLSPKRCHWFKPFSSFIEASIIPLKMSDFIIVYILEVLKSVILTSRNI